MNVTSKTITIPLSNLKTLIKSNFAGVAGSADKTGGFSVVCDPKCMDTPNLSAESLVDAVLTVVQWSENVPLSAGMQLSIDMIIDPKKVTFDQALAALQDTIKRKA